MNISGEAVKHSLTLASSFPRDDFQEEAFTFSKLDERSVVFVPHVVLL